MDDATTGGTGSNTQQPSPMSSLVGLSAGFVLSVLVWSLYAVACRSPVAIVVDVLVRGTDALAMGWRGALCIPWSANVFLVVGWFLLLCRRTKVAMWFGFAAASAGLTSVVASRGHLGAVPPFDLQFGYWIWQTCLTVFALGALVMHMATKSTRSPILSKVARRVVLGTAVLLSLGFLSSGWMKTLTHIAALNAPAADPSSVKENADYVASVAFSPDGHTLGSWHVSTVTLWNVETGKKTATLKGDLYAMPGGFLRSALAFSRDGKTLATGSVHGALELWNIETGENIASLTTASEDKSAIVHSAIWAWASPRITVIDCVLALHVAKSPVAFPREFFGKKRDGTSIQSVAFSPDGKTLAAAWNTHEECTIKLWNLETRQNTITLKKHDHFVVAVAYTPDGKTLASASMDGIIKLWDVQAGTNIATLTGQSGDGVSLTFSPDGKTLAAGFNGIIKLWEVKTGENITTLKGHTGGVHFIAFSPDGKTLAAGSHAAVYLWDVKSGKNTATFWGLMEANSLWRSSVKTGGQTGASQELAFMVTCVAFSPAGNTVASGYFDGTVKLWALPGEK